HRWKRPPVSIHVVIGLGVPNVRRLEAARAFFRCRNSDMRAQTAVLMRAPARPTNKHGAVMQAAGTFRPSDIDYRRRAPGGTLAPRSFADISVFARAERPSVAAPALPRVALQRKLAVGAVDDPLEHEADHVADKVMRMSDPLPVPRASALRISRKCAA